VVIVVSETYYLPRRLGRFAAGLSRIERRLPLDSGTLPERCQSTVNFGGGLSPGDSESAFIVGTTGEARRAVGQHLDIRGFGHAGSGSPGELTGRAGLMALIAVRTTH
jgi:hypothetical protein